MTLILSLWTYYNNHYYYLPNIIRQQLPTTLSLSNDPLICTNSLSSVPIMSDIPLTKGQKELLTNLVNEKEFVCVEFSLDFRRILNCHKFIIRDGKECRHNTSFFPGTSSPAKNTVRALIRMKWLLLIEGKLKYNSYYLHKYKVNEEKLLGGDIK